MTEIKTTKIPRRQKCVDKDHPYIGGSVDVIDDALGKPQSQVNQERISEEANLDGKIALEKQRAEGVESGLNNRLSTVEQLAEISIGGGDAQIATGADFTNPDATKRAKVPTVGAIVDGLNDGIYDVSKRNPTGGPNNDGKFTLDYILDNANTLIPTGWRHGGMTISFVQTSDNKYVQYRCISNVFSTNIEDWVGEDIKVENDTDIDFSIKDERNYDIVRFSGGHVQTKNFDSQKVGTELKEDGIYDFSIEDEENNLLAIFNAGHVRTKNFSSKDIEERVSALEGNSGSNIILTVGDSLTEGSGAQKNYKGETLSTYYNYTSWMQTKTTDYLFSKHGIGGENSPAILGRMYGVPLVPGQKFTLPADTSPVEINLVSSWYDKENEGRRAQGLGGVSAETTGIIRDTNPCTINGIPVTLSLSLPNMTYCIQRNTAAAESVDILADTPIIPNNFSTYKDNTYGLVFWCGTNDPVTAEYTQELIEHIRKTAEIYNTKKYVVVGIHYITNEITLAIRQRQEIQFQDAFGDKFINWREYASNFAIRDAISRGYIENTGVYPTSADITAMNEGKVPPTLLVDAVHLCQEGYMLVGDLIYDRLVSLGYINEN